MVWKCNGSVRRGWGRGGAVEMGMIAQHPSAKIPLRNWGFVGEGREEEEEEKGGLRAQHGEVEMWRWSGYLMAGG